MQIKVWIESNSSPRCHVTTLFWDKYHSRPHPLLMKCEARAISRDLVLMRAIELRLYARLVSSAWWRRRLDHAVLFKSFISVTHCPSQRNWWIVQIYGIPMPEQVGIFFRGFARFMRVSHCSSGCSLVRDRDDVTHRSCANFKCLVSHVNKQLPVDFMGVKCVSVECDQPRRWIHFKAYLFRLICRLLFKIGSPAWHLQHFAGSCHRLWFTVDSLWRWIEPGNVLDWCWLYF